MTGLVLGNTTELGGVAQITVLVRRSPTSKVRCDVTTSASTEAVLDTAVIVFSPTLVAMPLTAIGVKDVIDDGAMPFRVLVGPCKSEDEAFNFAAVHAVASGFNLHHPFPQMQRVQPETASLVGQQVTLVDSTLYSYGLYTAVAVVVADVVMASRSHSSGRTFNVERQSTSTASMSQVRWPDRTATSPGVSRFRIDVSVFRPSGATRWTLLESHWPEHGSEASQRRRPPLA